MRGCILFLLGQLLFNVLYAASARLHDRYAAASPLALKAAFLDIRHTKHEWRDFHANSEAWRCDPDDSVSARSAASSSPSWIGCPPPPLQPPGQAITSMKS